MTPAQQDLVTAHMDLVRRIAGRHAKRLPTCIDMDEIVAAGNLGLCQAAERFDSSKHASFAAWASFRIHGAIMDNFEGPRYPRRYVEMPPEWLLGDASVRIADGTTQGLERYNETTARVPHCLIDRSSSLDDLVEREQCVVVSIDAVRARKTLNREEGAIIDGHIANRSLTEIAAKRGISRGKAHKLLTVAKRKMRTELERDKEAA